ncbi:hypothetical protein LPA07_06660 [Lactiplantibacillus paraplantarum]|nr:hypothetical protein LPA07_06660 [Lactiplantibacillus paraplantarum]
MAIGGIINTANIIKFGMKIGVPGQFLYCCVAATDVPTKAVEIKAHLLTKDLSWLWACCDHDW